MKILKRNSHYLFDVFAFVSVFLTFPLFFYKLGQTSLTSWDEAWYAEVARNMLKTGDIINMSWNNHLYNDHPPAGYWIMAFFYQIFGVNEFWTRFPSALAGIISMLLLYFLGKKLFNPLVGLVSSIALSSAIWFIYRSRLGDLDILLTMFFLLTILLAIKAYENKKFIFPLAISITLLFLTKTMVPLVIIPLLIFIFYKNKLYKWYEFILPITLILVVAGGWFTTQIFQDDNFIHDSLGIGLRGMNLKSNYLDNINLAKEYLHSGIGKWFWPGIASIFLSVFLKQKRFFLFTFFFVCFMLPIIFSPKIQIWHLIPMFPILILVYFGFVYVILEKYLKHFKYQIFAIFIFFNSIIYFNQVKMIWYQFIDIPAFVSDEAILSKEAGKYPQHLNIDGVFMPTAIFYSEKGTVNQIQIERLNSLLNSNEEFLLITRKGNLINNKEISEKSFQILKEDRDKVLILHKPL
ncbi:MAG: glycosyltransferase family 39 protein [Candidatus Daviesbacteria bacterium]|nr:glycosyltransferase family 39 protein [Candidatus Daviesbacteria bacterium]